MHRHWDSRILPLFDIVVPRVVIEIGARTGHNTKRILEYCAAYGAHAHIIDPEPIGNRGEIAEALGAAGTYHPRISLDALPGLAGDLLLIDGDHNWYTVFHELRTMETTARGADRWPVCLLHDVGWPYGRRDGYYVPERIPAAYRQPYARLGMAFGRGELQAEGGLNAGHCNALVENGPRNGVLTAVEDFIAASSERWELAVFPPFHGLGLLYPPARLAETQAVELARFATAEAAERERMQELEHERLQRLSGDHSAAS